MELGAVGGADVADAAGNDGEGEHAAGQILGGGDDAGGDVAAGHDAVLQACHELVDGAGAEAAPGGGIVGAVDGGEGPVEGLGAIAGQFDALDAEARGFVHREGGIGAVGGRGFEADVGRAFELFAQLALALLLAEEFLGIGDAGWGLGVASGRDGEEDEGGAGGQGLAVAGSEVS